MTTPRPLAVSDAKARVQDGLADGEAALDKTQSQLKEAVTDGQQRVAGAVTTVANAVGQPSLGISSWSASGSTSGEQVTSPTVTLSNGTDSLSLGSAFVVSTSSSPSTWMDR